MKIFREANSASKEDRDRQKKALDTFIAKQRAENIEKLELYNLKMARISKNDRDERSIDRFEQNESNKDALRIFSNVTPEYSYGIMVYGPPGTGKTHLLKATIIEKVKQGRSCMFYSMNDLADEFRNNLNNLESIKNKLSQLDVLGIDDFGAEMSTEFVGTQLLSLMDKIVSGKTILLGTTNLTLEELNDKYGVRVFDRLIGCVKFVKIIDKSRRMENYRKGKR